MATTIQFYQLLTTPLERALPKLLEKAYGGGYRVLVVATSDAQVEQLDESLWTYDPNSFLPHGKATGEHAKNHPILLSTTLDAPNGANLLAVTNGMAVDNPASFERILDMFDGNNPEALAGARNRWKQYKETGNPLAYFKQTQTGGWEQKAVT